MHALLDVMSIHSLKKSSKPSEMEMVEVGNLMDVASKIAEVSQQLDELESQLHALLQRFGDRLDGESRKSHQELLKDIRDSQWKRRRLKENHIPWEVEDFLDRVRNRN